MTLVLVPPSEVAQVLRTPVNLRWINGPDGFTGPWVEKTERHDFTKPAVATKKQLKQGRVK